MRDYLAKKADQVRLGFAKRFTPRLWTVDFARPMMAALTSLAPKTLRVDLDFLTHGDLAGVIWTSEDRWSHPLLSYRTDHDYRGVNLSFDWVAGPGMMPLDLANGATLTIEGRDAEGLPRTWYVRLWNYAQGTPMSARISLNFSDLRAGFAPDGELVFAGAIDKLFVSLVPQSYDGTDLALSAPISTFVELRAIACTGLRSTLAIGDAFLPEHKLRMASGYDDSYNQAPERLVEQWVALGYRGLVNHYVGMSHYYALAHAGSGRFEVASGLCSSADAWHRAFADALRAQGLELIISLSFELFAANAPSDWVQRDMTGEPALTGWVPPSALLSPVNVNAQSWLQGIARAFVALISGNGQPIHFQVGEPWWWVGPSKAPCFYDPATVDRWTAEKGNVPPQIADVRGSKTAAELDFLDWLGVQLAAATAAVREAARTAANGSFASYLLFYAPQVLDSASPELRRANMPAGWAYPEWDVLQLEDYTYVTAGDEAGMLRGRQAVAEQLGYPLGRQHYLAGFVLAAPDASAHWPLIANAARQALKRETLETFIWAWPQVARDGFVAFQVEKNSEEGGEEVEAFHDERFPLALGFEAVGGPEFSTQVALMASGFEQRNVQWASARLRYDAGLGIRSEADLVTLLSFFRARRGQAFAFRFRDPIDWKSCSPDLEISPTDQLLGVGDGLRLRYPLAKHYGTPGAAEERRITRPDPLAIRISLAGEEVSSGWTLHTGGVVQFDEAPGPGVEVRAGFAFDVPVRFATDRIEISLSEWRAGEIPQVPLLEVRE